MDTKINLLELSDSEKIALIKAAKERLLQQVSEERYCRAFAQIYGLELNFNFLNLQNLEDNKV